MSLLDLRTAIVDQLLTKLAPVKAESHGGRFTLADLQRIATGAPTVRVACLGVTGVEQSGGSVSATARWGAFVLTKDQRQLPRDHSALLITAQILASVVENRWGLEAAELPTDLRGDNLYSGKLENKGVALWAVTWTQTIEIETLDFESLVAFATFHQEIDIDMNQAGEPLAADTVEMEQ